MDSRTIDKRKARDKETDSDASDTSLIKNPTKRARVEYSPCSSPLLKTPQVADSSAAATPAAAPNSSSSVPSPSATDLNNGDASVAPTSADNDAAADPGPVTVVISKFDLATPSNKQELDLKIDGASTPTAKGESDQCLVVKTEKNQIEEKNDGLTASKNNVEASNTLVNGKVETHSNSSPKKNAGTNTDKPKPGPIITSSPNNSDLVTDNSEVEVTLLIRDSTTRHILLDTTVKSDFLKMQEFCRQHDVTMESSQSGYLGDISASLTSSSGNSRLTTSSLGSTIPRQSIVSIATVTSESSDELMRRPVTQASKARKGRRNDGPIMSSTKIMEGSSNSSSSSTNLVLMNVSSNPVSNGGNNSTSSSDLDPSGKNDSPSKKGKMNAITSRLLEGDEGLGASPGTNSTPKSNKSGKGSSKTSTPSSIPDLGQGDPAKKPAAARRRRGGSSNFPLANIPPAEISHILSTPPPVRSVAKIEGSQAKPLSKFEQHMNDEEVNESELQDSTTLFCTILPQEPVFARWRDKNYYSGLVKSKGLNDTWHIDFDDGMADVASETHIIPVRILGVGVRGIYCPDDHYEAKPATIIGQKFEKDEDGQTAVKYAIKCDGDSKPMWCSRRQLSLKESEAKKLRADSVQINAVKPGDVSLDNIVSGPRRRARPVAEADETSTKAVVGGAFDASTADEKLLAASASTSTPKPRGTSRGSKKTPASSAKKRQKQRGGSSDLLTASTLTISQESQSVEGTPNPPKEKESPAKESLSPARVSKPPPPEREPPKKKNKKPLFHGMKFFLTASGGGDPGISGTLIPPTPYDKDEYRDLIEKAGGEVIDSVGDENQKEKVFLVSDSYARTVKYIYCLAAGIPCVSHAWIKQCLDTHEIADWKVFILPAGWSIERQDLVQHHSRKPLKGCKVFVTSESDQLYNYWKPVLTAAESVLLKPSKKRGGNIIPAGTEIIVTDHSEATHAVLTEARSLRVPVVKPEWLVQTIITGERADFEGHDRYRIDDLSDTEDSGADVASAVDGANDHDQSVQEVFDEMTSPD